MSNPQFGKIKKRVTVDETTSIIITEGYFNDKLNSYDEEREETIQANDDGEMLKEVITAAGIMKKVRPRKLVIEITGATAKKPHLITTRYPIKSERHLNK